MQPQKKKLPIGIQTFKEIRSPEENYAYVDKTDICYRLITNAKYYFLSRPRRFGKSLFLDTLSEIFKGSQELFRGLDIYDKWDWNESFPVIQINFATGDFSSPTSIKNRIDNQLRKATKANGIDISEIESEDLGIMLEQLIFELYTQRKQRVVVLIDEYDKAILDNISNENKSIALAARDILRNFYSAIKSSDSYLRFVFITGVSKFSKLNLFSGLNNIEDITIDKRYATITGYTQGDLETVFSDYTEGLDLQKVKRWYNGYNYFGEPVYNPYDILLFFAKGNEFRNYWWQTGNPTFLIDKLKESHYFLPDLENLTVDEETLDSFDVEHIDIIALLWQTGYLTFAEKIEVMDIISYKMKLPNLEIQYSLNAIFFDYLTGLKRIKSQKLDITRSLLARDFDRFAEGLKAVFASIPYQNYVNNNISTYEGYYASVLYSLLCTLGFQVIAEDTTNKGRIDMTLIGPDCIFILEFKVDSSQIKALEQIRAKKYFQKYLTEKKEIFLIGIDFDSNEKNICGFDYELLN